VWGTVKALKPRFILATVGSLGDLHPFIALGLALRARGAYVVVATAEEYRPKVERAGLVFGRVRPSFDDMQRHLGMDRAELTRAVLRRGDFLLRRLIIPHIRGSYEDMVALMDGADMVLTSSLAFGARLAAEKYALPWIGVVLQPLMFLSAFDPPVVPEAAWLAPVLRRLGPLPTRWVLELAKRAFAGAFEPLHALRAEIGLEPTRLNPLFEGQFGASGAIGLYSSLIGNVRADYPKPTALPGFASFDSNDGAPPALDRALAEFLDAGPPPLVFTLGSLIVHSPGAFYRESVTAARILGMRAVLLVGEDAAACEEEGLRGAQVHVCGYAPHSLLFPRAAAVVHQGGIGTLAHGLGAGRPQLIVPFYADQRDNAARAIMLGVARQLLPRRYDGASAARHLELLFCAPPHRSRAAEVSGQLAKEDGAAAAASIVLDRLESHRSPGKRLLR